MKKIPLKKLLGTALLLTLSLESNHSALASKIDMSKLSPNERSIVAALRRDGKSDDEITIILETDKKNRTNTNSGPNQQHLDEIKNLHEKEKAEMQQKMDLQEKELQRLRTKEDERLHRLTGQDGGKSIPKMDILSIAEIARLQEENKKLARVLKSIEAEGFEEGDPTYKSIKERLERTQSELEKVKREVVSRSELSKNQPEHLPPMQQKPTNNITNDTPQSGGLMKRGGPPPRGGEMSRGGPPPRGGPIGGGVTEQTAEELKIENNKLLIGAFDKTISDLEKSISELETITSPAKKEQVKLLIREILGALKGYAQQNPQVPGDLGKGTVPVRQKKVMLWISNLVSRLNIEATITQFDKSSDVKALNTQELPEFISKLSGWLEKTEAYIHTTKGNPLELKGQNFVIGEVLVPKNVNEKTSSKDLTQKPAVQREESTLKDTLKVVFNSEGAAGASKEVLDNLEYIKASPSVFSDISAKEPQALNLLEDASLSVSEIQELWAQIPEKIKNDKIQKFEEDLYNTDPIKGMKAETDFRALLDNEKRENTEMSSRTIGLAKQGSKVGVYRDTTLKNFMKLKFIAEIILAYRATLGTKEDDELKLLKAKIDATNLHKESVEKGSSPVKEETLKRLSETIKSLEDDVIVTNKKKEVFDSLLKTTDKIVVRLHSLFAKDYVLPTFFKEFMRSSEAEAITQHPDVQKGIQDLEDKRRQREEEIAKEKIEKELAAKDRAGPK